MDNAPDIFKLVARRPPEHYLARAKYLAIQSAIHAVKGEKEATGDKAREAIRCVAFALEAAAFVKEIARSCKNNPHLS